MNEQQKAYQELKKKAEGLGYTGSMKKDAIVAYLAEHAPVAGEVQGTPSAPAPSNEVKVPINIENVSGVEPATTFEATSKAPDEELEVLRIQREAHEAAAKAKKELAESNDALKASKSRWNEIINARKLYRRNLSRALDHKKRCDWAVEGHYIKLARDAKKALARKAEKNDSP